MNAIKFISKRLNFFAFSLLNILTMILSLVTNIFIVRRLSVEDYGVFSIALMIVGLLTTFGFSWSSSSILY
ncbi:oligosaccharide flippase family protein, partial [Staphylococcus sp. SIMBA_130]